MVQTLLTSLMESIRLRWLALAFVPSSLLLSVTTYLTTDLAPIPLLWVIPLSIYLLTFVLTFGKRPRTRLGDSIHKIILRWAPLVALMLAILILREATEPLFLVVVLHLLGLFWLAMLCHGELARGTPVTEQLTEFYFWLALGGALGGLFNALLAPWLFSSLAEYPIMVVAACLVRPQAKTVSTNWLVAVSAAVFLLLLGFASSLLTPGLDGALLFALPLIVVYFLQRDSISFGVSLAMVFIVAGMLPGGHGRTLWQQRSFFGVHRVTEQDGFRKLFHGHTLHGQQSLKPGERDEPLSYYHRSGPIGQVLRALSGDPRLGRVGLIGLGTGALASYAPEQAYWTFFEIDSAVVYIAAPHTGLFSFLKDSRGKIAVVEGDGRLSLEKTADKFGMLIIDAFGSDAIPLHLLTREALQIYMERLHGQGILAFHISNRFVDLEPVLANLAQAAVPKLVCKIQRDLVVDHEETQKGKSPSVWVLLARAERDLAFLVRDSRWQTAQPRPDLAAWTDDYSNLLSVLDWTGSKE